MRTIRVLIVSVLSLIALLPATAAWADHPPTNDDFAAAEPLIRYRGSTVGQTEHATNEPGEPFAFVGSFFDGTIWYTWVAEHTTAYRFSVCEQENKIIAVYTGNALNALALLDIGGTECPSGNSGIAEFAAVAGTTYRIQVHGNALFPGLDGFNVSLSWQPLCTISGNGNLVGTKHTDVICGGPGNDTLTGLEGDDILIGFGGNDTLLGGRGDDMIDGDVGVDTAAFHDSGVAGGVTVDLIAGTATNTVLGSDTLFILVFQTIENVKGSPGNDVILGDVNNNLLMGEGGDDRIEGGPGNDLLRGGPGEDRLLGQFDDDRIQPGAGDDLFAGGGAGTDTLDYSDLPITGAGQIVELFEHDTEAFGAAGRDPVAGFENLIGSKGDDFLVAHLPVASLVVGGLGNDTINTQDFDSLDTLSGGAGSDACFDNGDTVLDCS